MTTHNNEKKQIKQILCDHNCAPRYKQQCDYTKVLDLFKNGTMFEPTNSSEDFFIGVYYDFVVPDDKTVDYYKKAISGGHRDAMYYLQGYYSKAGLYKISDPYFAEMHCNDMLEINKLEQENNPKQKKHLLKIAAKNGNIAVIATLLKHSINTNHDLYIENMKILIDTIINDFKNNEYSFSGKYLIEIYRDIFPTTIMQIHDDLLKYAQIIEKRSGKCNHLKIIANDILSINEGGLMHFQKSAEYCLKVRDAYEKLSLSEKKAFCSLSNRNLIQLGYVYSRLDKEKTLAIVPQIEKILATDESVAMDLGIILNNVGQYNLAHKYYKMAYKAGNRHALCDIGCIFYNLRKKDEAIKCFDILIKQSDLCKTCISSMLYAYKEYGITAGVNKCHEIMKNKIPEKPNMRSKFYEKHHF
jgi:TPR repeat protein